MTPERFAKGMTFDEYAKYVASPENLAREAWGGYFPDAGSIPTARKDNSAVFRERYARVRLGESQAAAIKWLAAQPNGPARILMISEDWSSDCRRDVPIMARLAEAGGLELRIFNRDGKKILGTRRPDPAAHPDGNHDLMLRVSEREERRRVGVAAGGRVLHQGLPGAAPLHRVPGYLPQGPDPRITSKRPGPARRRRRPRTAISASSSPCRARHSSTSGRWPGSTRS